MIKSKMFGTSDNGNPQCPAASANGQPKANNDAKGIAEAAVIKKVPPGVPNTAAGCERSEEVAAQDSLLAPQWSTNVSAGSVDVESVSSNSKASEEDLAEKMTCLSEINTESTNDVKKTEVLNALTREVRWYQRNADSLVNKETHKFGITLLHTVAARGFTDLARDLIGCDADPNQMNMFGQTPLYKAAANGFMKTCEVLIAGGANVNFAETVSGYTQLHLAVSGGFEKTFTNLLELPNADINSVNNRGRTLLHSAAFSGSDHFNSPLYGLRIARRGSDGYIKIARALLERGAKVDAKDNDGCTPYDLATRAVFGEMVTLLSTRHAE